MNTVTVQDATGLIDLKPRAIIGAGDRVWEVLPPNDRSGIDVTFTDGTNSVTLRVRVMGKMKSWART